MNHQRLSRLQFLSSTEPEPSVSVRAAFAKSWQRSRLSGVKPGRFAPPYAVIGAEQEQRLLRAVRPVLQRFAEQLSDCRMSVIVTNPQASIADRWVANRHLERQLDRIMLAAGFSYAEEHVGTNAIGTAVEQGCPVAVAGGEHFADALQDMGCAAAPIRDPRSGRVLGIIDVTSVHRDFNPVMPPLVLQAAADVEQRMVDEASIGEAGFRGAARSLGPSVPRAGSPLTWPGKSPCVPTFVRRSRRCPGRRRCTSSRAHTCRRCGEAHTGP